MTHHHLTHHHCAQESNTRGWNRKWKRQRETRRCRLLPAALALWGLGGLLLAPALPVRAQSAKTIAMPAGVQRVTSVEGITEYRLANGLRVLLFPDASKQTITVNITYLVGSRNENYGETGMAHLLEHLMFKGSPRYANTKQALNEHGANWNGTTSYDRTNYFETFPANDTNLDWALDFEADRMTHAFIARKDLDSEMTVVRNEFEIGENSPTSILMERTLSAAYLWHHYGKSVIGARADIENVPIDRLQAFWRTHYQPDNAVLLVAGKFDEAKTLARISQKFSPIPRPTRALQKTYTAEPPQDGERTVTLRRVGDVQAVCAAYHIPAGSHPDAPGMDVLAQILTDTPSGRLYKNLVEPKLASSLWGFSWQLREPGVMIMMAEVPKDKPLEAARAALVSTVDDLAKHPPTEEEVSRARTQLLKQIDLQLRSSEDVGLALSEWEAMGDWRLLYLYRDRLKQVTQSDIARLATAYMKPDNRTMGLFTPTPNPDRATIPVAPDIADALKNYKGGEAIAAGEAFDSSPANIDKRTQRPDAAGLKLSLLPKLTRGNTVVVTLQLHLGSENSLRNRVMAGSLAGSMLMRGTTKHTRQQIQDAFDALKANAYVGGGATSVYASIETTRENLPGALRLVAEILRSPSFPAKEFDTLKQERITSIEQQKSEPASLANLTLMRALRPYPKGDVRHVSLPDESIADINATTLDDTKKFYTDFYGASNGELAIVGDFDAAEMAKLAQELFGDWKSAMPYVHVPNPYQKLANINETLQTPDKANAMIVAALPIKLRDDNPDYAALQLGNYILGGAAISSRLGTRIRDKDGLSYGVGSYLSADSEDESGRFGAYAMAAPENIARVETAFREEVARALKDGFTADEVAKAKAGFLQSRQVQRAEDYGLVGSLARQRYLNRTMAFDAALEQRINALTPEQVIEAMRKYVTPEYISIVKAGDFNKAAKTTKTPNPAPVVK